MGIAQARPHRLKRFTGRKRASWGSFWDGEGAMRARDGHSSSLCPGHPVLGAFLPPALLSPRWGPCQPAAVREPHFGLRGASAATGLLYSPPQLSRVRGRPPPAIEDLCVHRAPLAGLWMELECWGKHRVRRGKWVALIGTQGLWRGR